jgi:hypothetical protein
MIVGREAGAPLVGRLTYVEGEYGFRFDVDSPADLLERAGGSDLASVSIGTLQIEVGVASRCALFVWGMHPRASWGEASLPWPKWISSAAVLGPEIDYSAGESIRIADVGDWSTTYDPASGWVRVSAHSKVEDELVEVATGILLGSINNELVSVWLMPNFE